ncbi:MAG: late competence development ComFB family protein [Treponema sp.]|jgi:competence protein ComFB|nr:late competence development ComFB family protein [Treponema sp.]
MELHNTAEDLVFARVDEIFNNIEKGDNPDRLCTCDQCRVDTACYVLNRTNPHYIVSSRGAARVEQAPIRKQQEDADITTLVYEGIRRVNHNQRPSAVHGVKQVKESVIETPVFNIPTIVGRIFNGVNFAPVSGVLVQLFSNGGLVAMKDNNWQNPCPLVSNTDGAFTFWPNPIPAETGNIHRVFEFSIRIESENYETLNHFFKIPVISDTQAVSSFSLVRTVKLPDLYLFPPGSEDDDLI